MTSTTPSQHAAHPGPTLGGSGDEERRRALRRMRSVATGLLVVAAVVFLLTHGRAGAWGYVNAAAEAGMVGAMADWFAVTALFRHPLGLPVPHTALIPRKKDSLGESLEEFVTENFLTADLVRERLAQAQVPLRAAEWLSEPQHARRVVDEVAPTLTHALSSVRDDEVRVLLQDFLLPRLAREPASPLAGSLLEVVVHDGTHRGLVDLAVDQLHEWVCANKATIASILGARAPWWSPRWLDETVIDRVYAEVVTWVREVRDTPTHPARLALDDLLATLAQDLQRDPETMQRAEALKERLLTHPGVADGAMALWTSVRASLGDALQDPGGPLRTRLAVLLTDAGRRLVRDARLREVADRRLADAVTYVVTHHGREISTLISQTVARWDGDEAARRIELQVGRDLQFIRINGTVVGALVGLVLHTLTQLL